MRTKQSVKNFFDTFWLFNRIRYCFTPLVFKRKRRQYLLDNSPYLSLNLACGRKYCYGYVNCDEYRCGKRIFIASFRKLPFNNNEVKKVLTDYNRLVQRGEKELTSIFAELYRVMLPAGILCMDNYQENLRFESLLTAAGFKRFAKGNNTLFSMAHFIRAASRNPGNSQVRFVMERKNGQVSVRVSKKQGVALEEIYTLLGPDTFSEIRLTGVLEYIPVQTLEEFLKNLFRALRDEGTLSLEVASFEARQRTAGNYFDKTNLAQFLHQTQFTITHMSLVDEIVHARAQKPPKPGNVSKGGIQPATKEKKICLVGQYMFYRYSQLGFTWGGIPHAAQMLGMEHRLIEGMRNQNVRDIQDAVLSFRPDYLLLVLRETIPLFFDIRKKLRSMGTKVLFWFCDPEQPKAWDLSELIDIMFLTNEGQLDAYRRAYNLNRIYYMPQGIDPAVMFYNAALPEIYDVGFSGALSSAPLHVRRRVLIEKLKKRYTVATTSTTRNNIAEFYSQSRTVFGISDFNARLYTSNRFFNALGCGAVYVCGKFQGIELLAEHKKHLVWFKNERELFDLMEYYLSRDDERKKIRIQAQTLAHTKHTWTHRLQNIIDITEGKADSFYGYL